MRNTTKLLIMFWSAVLAGTLASVGLATEIQTPFTKDCIVPGKAFDRIVFIWLENTDYEMAIGDRTHLDRF